MVAVGHSATYCNIRGWSVLVPDVGTSASSSMAVYVAAHDESPKRLTPRPQLRRKLGNDNRTSRAPMVDGFQQAIRAGRLKPGAPETKHILGKMFLASFMSGVDTPRFDAAV